jgi:hypothetical protein
MRLSNENWINSSNKCKENRALMKKISSERNFTE